MFHGVSRAVRDRGSSRRDGVRPSRRCHRASRAGTGESHLRLVTTKQARSVTLQADHAPVSGAIAGGFMRLTYDATTDVAYLSLRPLAPVSYTHLKLPQTSSV